MLIIILKPYIFAENTFRLIVEFKLVNQFIKIAVIFVIDID